MNDQKQIEAQNDGDMEELDKSNDRVLPGGAAIATLNSAAQYRCISPPIATCSSFFSGTAAPMPAPAPRQVSFATAPNSATEDREQHQIESKGKSSSRLGSRRHSARKGVQPEYLIGSQNQLQTTNSRLRQENEILRSMIKRFRDQARSSTDAAQDNKKNSTTHPPTNNLNIVDETTRG